MFLPAISYAGRWLITSWVGRAIIALVAIVAFGAYERHKGASMAKDKIEAAQARQVERAINDGDKAAAIAGGDDPVDRLRRGDW